MATIHDVMPAFELFQPASIDDTLSLLERHRRSVWVLAGGLDAGNVAEAIRTVRPFGVDVSSGVERARGVKDPARIRDFIDAARGAGPALTAEEERH